MEQCTARLSQLSHDCLADKVMGKGVRAILAIGQQASAASIIESAKGIQFVVTGDFGGYEQYTCWRPPSSHRRY